ncbi:wiskott-Aldrich syndrome protein homolog 1 isoform X2 [Thalassophryne amazonica]|uniref:wiskott-Aldrich syndrome protein homolog 1 isoform X2 n=1 Tax=Thalassophryne amazonica TaxID=390379 RepID=UPI001470E073|nr:wiskott-Aldrich syndrome protein homolog 1 isoform X2 [Thalassophryne amazonica]
MSYSCRETEEEWSVGGIRAGLKAKPRFSFTEVKVLLEAVKRNRYIILKKFNQGVSAESKKQTWAKITDQINNLGENHREVRQIMKKWADLKCDGKRRIAALRGPNGCNLRKKHLGPVEKMVHKILMMSPGDVDNDLDFGEDEDFLKLGSKGPSSSSYSYISLTDNLSGSASHDLSPLSSPEKEPSGEPFHSSSEFDLDLADDGEHTMDFDDNDDSMFSYRSTFPPPAAASLDPLPDNSLPRIRPIYTYSRNSNSNQNHNHVQNNSTVRPPSGPSCSSVASTSSAYPVLSDSDAASSSIAPPPLQCSSNSSITVSSLSAFPPSSFSFTLPPASPSSSLPSTLNDSISHAASSTSSILPPAPVLPAPLPLSAAPAPPVSAPPTVSSSSPAPSAPSFSVPPLPQSTSSSISHQPMPSSSSSSSAPPPNPLSTSSSIPSDPLPPGASSRRSQDRVAQLATQSLQQQRASRMLLASVSQSLETLAQSVQLLVESQQEFVQESLLLQRETVDILRDFSNTALTMLREKSISGQVSTQHHLASHF